MHVNTTSLVVLLVALAVACLLLGAFAYRELTAWWLRWQMRKADAIRRNSPSVLKQKLKDMELLYRKEAEEAQALKLEKSEMAAAAQKQQEEHLLKIAELHVTIQDQEDEIRRLAGRNTLLSNEVRSDPTAKTIVFDPSRGSYRWSSKSQV